jgi:cytochrome c553
MKRLILSLLAAACLAGTAFAADVVKYETKTGTVTFNHKAHADTLKDCAKCHQGTPAKIEVTKDFAHKTCKGCHAEMSGPTKCSDCHKK